MLRSADRFAPRGGIGTSGPTSWPGRVPGSPLRAPWTVDTSRSVRAEQDTRGARRTSRESAFPAPSRSEGAAVRVRVPRPTYANVAATVALFAALGGTSYAAVTLPHNSIGASQIKNNSINSSKVKNGSLLKVDFKSGQLPRGATGAAGPAGPAGPAGAAGAAGAPGKDGTAKAYAYVDATGTLDPARSSNVTSVTTAGATLDCFVLPFTPKNVVASIQGYENGGPNNFGFVVTGIGTFAACPAGTTAYIATLTQAGAFTRLPVYVMFN
jgi:hypothetical protein